MKSFFYLVLTALLFVSFQAGAAHRKEFIRKYKHIAVKEMDRTGIPASIKMAQGILESGWGKSELACNANNHFGIKCHDWTGATYHMDDDAANECFRKYKNPEQSWVDHSTFLTSRPRYSGLFDIPATDYKAWAKGLKAAGYATNPTYAEQLIKIIEEEELYKFDHPVSAKEIAAATVKDEIDEYEELPLSSSPRPKNTSYRNREEMRNGVICIEAQPGDSYESIATYYNIKQKKLLSFNDRKDNQLKPGELVYIKRKKGRAARGYEFHRIKSDESLYEISQMYGVKLNSILKYNYLTPESNLIEGEKIYLRKKANIF